MLKSSLIALLLLLVGCSNVGGDYHLLTNENQKIVNYQLDNKFTILKKSTTKNTINNVHPAYLTSQVIEIVEGLKKRELKIFDLVKKQAVDISEEEDNPIIFYNDENYIYHSSNYVKDNYLKVYGINSKTSIKIKLKDYLVNSIIKNNDYLYVIVNTDSNEQNHLLTIKDNKIIKDEILKYNFDPNNNTLIKDNKLMYTYQDNTNHLISVDLINGTVENTVLKTNNNILKELNHKLIAYQRDLISNEALAKDIENISDNKIISFKQPIKEVITLENNILLISARKTILLDNDFNIIQEIDQEINGDIIGLNKNAS